MEEIRKISQFGGELLTPVTGYVVDQRPPQTWSRQPHSAGPSRLRSGTPLLSPLLRPQLFCLPGRKPACVSSVLPFPLFQNISSQSL